MLEKAATKPHDSLAAEPEASTPPAERPRDAGGRFAGPRVNVDAVPRLPTFPARWLLADPRRRPYLVYWQDRGGEIITALKMAVSATADTVVVTLRSGYVQRLAIRRRALPRSDGMNLFYLCPMCKKPRRCLYLWTRAEADTVDHFGLRCRQCADLRFPTQGIYISGVLRQLLAASFGPSAKPRLLLGNEAWDPKAVSDPRLLNLETLEFVDGQPAVSE